MSTDVGKVRQIVLNLLSNAVRFTEAGEVNVELELGEYAAVVRVRDTGIGIASEHAERIFEPFSQVTQSLTRHRGGTGLGLTVARQLARLLGGVVELASAQGQEAPSRYVFQEPPDQQCVTRRSGDSHAAPGSR